ncbi:MAG: hypothetical protein H6727_06445 [Myxococcales bacterium]|nr:hypothetical protein [Myxococcales bacterium]
MTDPYQKNPSSQESLPMAPFGSVKTNESQHGQGKERRAREFGSKQSLVFHSRLWTPIFMASSVMLVFMALGLFASPKANKSHPLGLLFFVFLFAMMTASAVFSLRLYSVKIEDGKLLLKNFLGHRESIPLQQVLVVERVYWFFVAIPTTANYRIFGRIELKEPTRDGKKWFFFLPKGLFLPGRAIDQLQEEIARHQTSNALRTHFGPL